MANTKNKVRMFSFEEWAALYKESGYSAEEISSAIGIPKTVFLRGVMPNGNRVAIPYKYEKSLYSFLNTKIKKEEVLPVEETVVNISELSEEDLQSKKDWLQRLRNAKAAL